MLLILNIYYGISDGITREPGYVNIFLTWKGHGEHDDGFHPSVDNDCLLSSFQYKKHSPIDNLIPGVNHVLFEHVPVLHF